MEVYVGDIYKKDVIKNIYDDLKKKYEGTNFVAMELTNEQLKSYEEKEYINVINGIKVDLHFSDDWVDFKDYNASLYLDAIFRIKLLDGIISYNDPALSMLKVNEEKIKDRKMKLYENETEIRSLGVSESEFKSIANARIIKNTIYDSNRQKAYLLWKKNNALKSDIYELKQDSDRIKYDIINRGLVRTK